MKKVRFYEMARSRLVRAALVAGAIASTGCSTDDTSGSSPSDGEDAAPPPPALSRSLPTLVEQADDLPGYNVYRPEDLDATGAALPVIVWANGGCYRYDTAWKDLLEGWARAGFFVVAITTPAGVDAQTAGLSSADDQALAIDWVETASEEGPYAGHLDSSRIVAAGNSCGGVTSLVLAARDTRVRSVFVLSGSSVFPGSPDEAAAEVMSGIQVPVGYAIGGPEDISRANAQRDYDFLPSGVPGYLARRFEGAHEVVSTDAGVLAEISEISTNWIDFSLNGNPEVEATLLAKPCGSCASDTWTVQAKNLDALVVP